MSVSEFPEAVFNIPGFSEKTRVEILTGGLSNSSWRITIDKNDYALRIGSQTRAAILREVDIWRLAAASALAPELYYVDADNGLIVSRWAEGDTWSTDDLDLVRLPVLGMALSQLHELEFSAQSMDFNECAESYCQRLDGPMLSLGKVWFAEMDRLLNELASSESRLCHNDLVAENMIYGSQLVFVDWEYAMANDPFFDLAVVCAHHCLDATATSVLLESYCGHADLPARERLGVWQQVYLRLYGLWLMAAQGERGAVKAAELKARMI